MLTHKGTNKLETERLVLRRFTIDDTEDMYNNWSSDEEVFKYLRGKRHNSLEEAREALRKRIINYDDKSVYYWAITLKSEDIPIGVIALMVEEEYDLCGCIAYTLSRAYWGEGIVSEALSRVIEYGFKEVNFRRIEAYHSINNIGSGRVMQKCGMKFEGRMRKKYKSHVGYEDSDLYAILKEDIINN